MSLTKGEGFLAEKSEMFKGKNELTYCECHGNCKLQLVKNMRWGWVGKKRAADGDSANLG